MRAKRPSIPPLSSGPPLLFSCPLCKVSWARVVVNFDSILRPEHFTILEPYKRKDAGLVGKKTSALKCPACKKTFTAMHIQMMIAKGLYGEVSVDQSKFYADL